MVTEITTLYNHAKQKGTVLTGSAQDKNDSWQWIVLL